MSELVWENTDAGDEVKINKHITLLLRPEALYIILVFPFRSYIKMLIEGNNIDILKQKAERIYQIIKE